MKLLRIESLTYGVSDLDVSKRYYDDWGLSTTDRGARGVDYLLPSGQTIALREVDDKSLPSAVEGGSTIREIVWGVEGAESLESLGVELSTDRDLEVNGGAIRTHDPSGMGVAFVVAKRVDTPPKTRERGLNRPFAVAPRIRPRRIGHIVFNIAEEKMQETTAFYLERLGFRLSDRVTQFGDFMRCSGSVDHHNLFLLRKPVGGFNHVAFEVENLDEVVVGGKFMLEQGWNSATTLGRHIMGSNVFWYFTNPSGGLSEYYCDMDIMDEDWEPRVWEKNPGFALWMT